MDGCAGADDWGVRAGPAGHRLGRRLLAQRARSGELQRVNLLVRLRAEVMCARAAQIVVVGAAERCLRDRRPVRES